MLTCTATVPQPYHTTCGDGTRAGLLHAAQGSLPRGTTPCAYPPRALAIGHWALGIGHWAWHSSVLALGIGHWAWGVPGVPRTVAPQAKRGATLPLPPLLPLPLPLPLPWHHRRGVVLRLLEGHRTRSQESLVYEPPVRR